MFCPYPLNLNIFLILLLLSLVKKFVLLSLCCMFKLVVLYLKELVLESGFLEEF